MGPILVSLLLIFFVVVGVLACNRVDDCPKGYSCMRSICTKCLTCSLLFRKGGTCVFDFKECGDCLEGYEEILVTDFSIKLKPCKLIEKKMQFNGCSKNNNCPPNNYCSEDSCVKCFNCTLVNRLPPIDKCAKGLDECGSYIIGNNEVSVTADTNSKRCENSSVGTNRTHPTQNLIETAAMFGYALMITSIWLLILIFLHKKKDRSLSKSISSPQIIPSAPPLCVLEGSEIEEGYNPFVSRCAEVDSSTAKFERERNQGAKVFQQPHALYYSMGEDENIDLQLADGNRSCGSNTATLPVSCVSPNSAQSETANYSGQRFFELTTDSTDSAVPGNSEIRIDPVSRDSVALDISNENHVGEPVINESTDTLPAMESFEQKNT